MIFHNDKPKPKKIHHRNLHNPTLTSTNMVGVMNPLVPLPNMRYEMYYQSPVYQQLFKDTLEKAVEESRVQQKDKIISINSPKNNGKNQKEIGMNNSLENMKSLSHYTLPQLLQQNSLTYLSFKLQGSSRIKAKQQRGYNIISNI